MFACFSGGKDPVKAPAPAEPAPKAKQAEARKPNAEEDFQASEAVLLKTMDERCKKVEAENARLREDLDRANEAAENDSEARLREALDRISELESELVGAKEAHAAREEELLQAVEDAEERCRAAEANAQDLSAAFGDLEYELDAAETKARSLASSMELSGTAEFVEVQQPPTPSPGVPPPSSPQSPQQGDSMEELLTCRSAMEAGVISDEVYGEVKQAWLRTQSLRAAQDGGWMHDTDYQKARLEFLATAGSSLASGITLAC